jgi:hypothetical protein
MKKYFIFFIAFALLQGCARENMPVDVPEGNGLKVTLLKETEPVSKVQFVDNPGIRMSPYWEAGDEIGVFGSRSGENLPYTVTADKIDGASALFLPFGDAADGALTAYYPFQEGASADGQKLTLVLPSTQKMAYRKNLPTPDKNAFLMAGKGSRNDGVELRNVLALLKVGYMGQEDQMITSVKFRDLSGKPVSGQVKIDWNGDIPEAEIIGNGESITLDCSPGVFVAQDELKYFFLVVPAREYAKGFEITFTRKDGTQVIKTVGAIYGKTLYRSLVHPVGDLTEKQSYTSDQVHFRYKGTPVVMDSDMWDLVESASRTSGNYPTASGDSYWRDGLEMYVHERFPGNVGDYFFMNSGSEMFPGGFIGRILEAEMVGDKRYLLIASLDDFGEAFEELVIGGTLYNEDGSVQEGGGLDLNLLNYLDRIETADGEELPFDIEGDEEDPETKAAASSSYKTPRLRVYLKKEGLGEASLGIQLQLNTKLSIGVFDGTTHYVHFNVNPKATFSLNSKLAFTQNYDALSTDWSLGTYYFAPIPVGPIVLTPSFTVDASLAASGTIELNTSLKYVSDWGTYGFSYNKGNGFTTRSTISQPSDEDGFQCPEFNLGGGFGVEAALKFKPEIGVYGLFKVGISTKIGLTFGLMYEGGYDADGFNNGAYVHITPSFAMTPVVASLGGAFTWSWKDIEPFEFEPIYQKYLLPSMKVEEFYRIAETGNIFSRDIGKKEDGTPIEYRDHAILGYTGVHYKFKMKKEVVLPLYVGVAVYEGTGFKYKSSSKIPDHDKMMDAGLEDYCTSSLYYGELLNGVNMGAFPITTYSGTGEEDVVVLEGDVEHKFENGRYYRIAPCIYYGSNNRLHFDYYVEPRASNLFVCHWPYSSNGDLLIDPEED